jgi:HK97 gp10 family phage protein
MLRAKVIGDGAVKLKLQKISQSIDSKVLFSVLLTSSKVLVDKMRELAPRSERGGRSKRYASRRHPPGYLKASIGQVKGRGKEYPTVWVRPRFTGGWDPWYAHFPMAGTKQMKKAPNPFVDRAWAEVGSTVKSNITTLINSIVQIATR